MLLSGDILYILSDVRSGSTLLDQLLGAHPSVVSVGELHWLRAYVKRDRRIYDPAHPLSCSCGERVTNCSFWNMVQAEAQRPLDSFQLHPRFSVWRRRGSNEDSLRTRLIHQPMRLLLRAPAAYRNTVVHRIFGGPRLAHDSVVLSDAILRATGKSVVVDSSKSAFKWWSVYTEQPGNVKAVILTRDYRAVVHSKMKRGVPPEEAAQGWRRKMLQIAAMTEVIPATSFLTLKYESLCLNPEQELRRICEFLCLEFQPAMLERPTDDVHHIGGSPSKFDPSKRKISLDTTHVSAIEPALLEKIDAVIGDVARSWGY